MEKVPWGAAALAAHQCGHALHPRTWTESLGRGEELDAQTRTLAARLEAAGQSCRQKPGGFRSRHLVGLVTGGTKRVEPWRHIKLLPSVMAADACGMLAQLTGFLSGVPEKEQRMWVVSWGWVPVSGLRRACRDLARAVSRLAAEEWMKAAGLEVLLRRTEFTLAPGARVNLHAHLVVRSRAVLGGASWQALLDRAKLATPKRYLHDSRLHDVREAVKYSFKPAELLAAENDTLKQIFEQTFKLRFLEPMGEFRVYRNLLKERRLGSSNAKEKVLGVDEWKPCLYKKEPVKAKYEKESRAPAEDIVLAITKCCAPFQARLEPCLIVANYSGDLDALIERRGLQKWRELALRAWACPAAPPPPAAVPSIRDTSTITVGTPPPPAVAVAPKPPATPQRAGLDAILKRIHLPKPPFAARRRPPPGLETAEKAAVGPPACVHAEEFAASPG